MSAPRTSDAPIARRTTLPSLIGALLAITFVACSSRARSPDRASAGLAPAGPRVQFSYQTIDGHVLSTETLLNRVSVIGFLTTYDVHSQAEARFLALLERHHTPRINVAALVLEAPENRPLVEAFATTLGLDYPIAMADAATIAGQGPFFGLHNVPSVVVLDRAGREAWRHVGFVGEAALEAAVRAVEVSSPPPQVVDDVPGRSNAR